MEDGKTIYIILFDFIAISLPRNAITTATEEIRRPEV